MCPSPLNAPLMGVGSSISVVSTTEIVAATSGPVNTDNLETVVYLEANLDFLNSSSGTTITLKLERGTAIGGTAITSGGTWGPFALTASARSNYGIAGYDLPGLVFNQKYVFTVTVAGNSGSPTIETATITCTSQSQS